MTVHSSPISRHPNSEHILTSKCIKHAFNYARIVEGPVTAISEPDGRPLGQSSVSVAFPDKWKVTYF